MGSEACWTERLHYSGRRTPVLGRLYAVLGTALGEARQLEKERALDHAQRITAAHGDERQHAHARVETLLLHLEMNPDKAEMEIAQALPDCDAVRREPRRSGNLPRPAARGRAALEPCTIGRGRIRLAARRRLCPQDERPEAAGRYRRLARLAALWGPTPAPDGIKRCQDHLDEIGNHPVGKAGILLSMAGLYAMQDDFATAQETINAEKCPAGSPRPHDEGGDSQPAALIAMLGGDPASAEKYLRLEFDSLSQMGDRRLLATTAATLARAIAAQGPGGYDEALRLIAISQEAAAHEDLSAQAIGRGLYARILADRGPYREAEEQARSAAAISAQTDLLTSTPTPCSNCPTSSSRPVKSPKHTPSPPRRSSSISARATCQEPGSRSDI